jgi:hypothetical protein
MQVIPATGGVVGGLAGGHEDAGADDGAHPQAGELDRTEDPAQAVLAAHLLHEQGQGLAGKQLGRFGSGHEGFLHTGARGAQNSVQV